MDVLIIQPPATSTTLLDQAEARFSHRAPPWPPLCLLSFLRQRTRHKGRIFDARIQRRWEQELGRLLDGETSVHLVAIECARHEILAARATAAAVRRHRPDLSIVGFGDAPTIAPATFLEESGFEYGIVGDPEPTLRHLLDNFQIAFRRQRIPGLLQTGVGIAAPLWAGDLRTLSFAEWPDLHWADYESAAYPGGLRADLNFSRGSGGFPVASLVRPGGAPLRMWPHERLIEAMQTCTQLGITEVHFDDPPEVWDEGRLAEWLEKLERAQNSQNWSLRLLALPLEEQFCVRLAANHCRRLELLVPTCDERLAREYGYEMPDTAHLNEMIAWFKAQGTSCEVVFWIGSAAEPRGEATRVQQMLRQLDFPPFALEVHPLTAPYDENVLAIASSVRRSLAFSPTRRLRKLGAHLRRLRISIDEEHRAPATQNKQGEPRS